MTVFLMHFCSEGKRNTNPFLYAAVLKSIVKHKEFWVVVSRNKLQSIVIE